jgi:hypothetical protein
MYANAIALSALLLGTGLLGPASAQAGLTAGEYGSAQTAPANSAAGVIRLAAGGKLGDKYMSGKAGGRYGIGGTAGGKKARKDGGK